jgi:hypothetical protein
MHSTPVTKVLFLNSPFSTRQKYQLLGLTLRSTCISVLVIIDATCLLKVARLKFLFLGLSTMSRSLSGVSLMGR